MIDYDAVGTWIDGHQTLSASILVAILIPTVKIIFQYLTKDSRELKPVFWGKHRVHVVETFELDLANHRYSLPTQYILPSAWQEIIEIKSSFFGYRHKIIPKNPTQRIFVQIHRWGKEKGIWFNR